MLVERGGVLLLHVAYVQCFPPVGLWIVMSCLIDVLNFQLVGYRVRLIPKRLTVFKALEFGNPSLQTLHLNCFAESTQNEGRDAWAADALQKLSM